MTASPQVSQVMRAAQYVRMSTEHQRYSIDNQIDFMRDYAAAHDIEIVRTYADAGKSGLHLKGRPGLQRLLADVQAGEAGFQALLVYDVSRWGRFQNTDETAYYAHICERAGVSIIYCAEPFQDYDAAFGIVIKSIKRAMAAEYSRELSQKVFLGQANVAGRGFRVGSPPGYALQRWVVGEDGKRKLSLHPGQVKGLGSDRVILAPGAPAEVANVKLIFNLYVNEGLTQAQIVRRLKATGVKRRGVAWNSGQIHGTLICEKYVGDNIYNRTSGKLGKRAVESPRAQWVRVNGAWDPIIDRDLFDRAQALMAERRPPSWSKAAIVAGLAELLKQEGRLTTKLVASSRLVPTYKVICQYFSSLTQAFAAVGYVSDFDEVHLEHRRIRDDLREAQLLRLQEGMLASGIDSEVLGRTNSLKFRGMVARLVAPLMKQSPAGRPAWCMNVPANFRADVLIAMRLDHDPRKIVDYYIIPRAKVGPHYLTLSEGSRLTAASLHCATVADVVAAFVRLRKGRKGASAISFSDAPWVPPPRQSRYHSAMSTPGERLRAARVAAGYTTSGQAAAALGVPLATYQQHENGIRGLPASRGAKYGRFFQVAPEWLIYGRGPGPGETVDDPAVVYPETRYVDIVGEAAAGIWNSEAKGPSKRYDCLPVVLPGFESAELFALRVRGAIMDLHYPDGAVVIAIDPKGLGVREGDHVVVRRLRGALAEMTLAEVVRDEDGVALVQRSSDRNLRKAFRLGAEGPVQAPQILGVVLASYYVRPKAQGPALDIAAAA